MSQTSQRSTNPADYQQVPRAVAAMPKDFAAGFVIEPHSHERAQLIYATAGTMRVATDGSMWVVPPQRALWMPAGVDHGIVMLSDVTMRTLYLRDDAAAAMPAVLPRAAGVAAAARADRAGHRAAAAVRRRRTGRPCDRPDPGRAARPAIAAACSCRCRRSRVCGRSARRCSTARAISARSANGRRPQRQRAHRGAAVPEARPASASARGGSRPGCSRRWAGWAAAPRDPGGARSRLRQRQRLQRHVPPRGRRLAQHLSARSRVDKALCCRWGIFVSLATVCHRNLDLIALANIPNARPIWVF